MDKLLESVKSKDMVIPLLAAPGVKLSETTMKENLQDTEVQYETLMRLIERFQPDGIFPFMDLTVEPEVLGLEVEFPENENPSVKEHSIKTIADLNKLKKRWMGPAGRMGVFIKLMEKLDHNFSGVKGGYVIGPFTLAGEMMGVNDISMKVITEPELVTEFVNFATEVISKYTSALFASGADTVAVLEPTPVILSPEHYDQFSLQPFYCLQEAVENQPLVLHICGDTTHLLPKMTESRAFGLSLDSEVDFKAIKEEIPENMVLIGNLDPTTVFLQSSPEEVKTATSRLKKEMKDMNNFIISSGCDIPLETPLENIDIFMETAQRF